MAIQKKKADPADRTDYGFDYADPKVKPAPYLSDGETLTSSTWTLYDGDWNVVTDVQIDDTSYSDTTTTAFFGPADDVVALRGEVRYLTNHIVTSQGREKDESYQFTFEEQ